MDGMRDGSITGADVRRMTRAQAIEALKLSEDPRDRGMAFLLAAGPQLTEEDETMLSNFMPRPSRMAVCVAFALRGLR